MPMVASGCERAVVRIPITCPACWLYVLQDARWRAVSRVATLYDLSEQHADSDVVTRASLKLNLHSC
jgi:hypothetical protein